MAEPITSLVQLRKKKGFTQIEFAKECNLTRQYLWLIETGRYRPSIETMMIISAKLDISAITIFKMFTQK